MKVIFLQNIKGTARVGDIKNVSDGYAKNFLFPNKVAKPATAASVKEIELLKSKASVHAELEEAHAKEIAEKIKNQKIEIKSKASETGTLFASVNKKGIANKINSQLGVHLKESAIDLKEQGENIKHTGNHEIELNLTPATSVKIKINVVAE